MGRAMIVFWAGLAVGMTAGCSSSGGGDNGSGGVQAGSGGSSTGGTQASGGTNGTGGTQGSGGSGAGGASGKGGASADGGSSATGGTASSGGVQATGGSSEAGSSGSGGSGGEGGSGGTTITSKDAAAGDSASVGAGGAATGGRGDGGGGASAGGSAGAGGVVGTGGSSGSSNCAGRALSLAANGTGSASDSAQAHVEIDMKTDLPTGNAKRTVEFWAFIKSTDWVGEKNQIFYYGGSDSNGSFGLDFGTNNVTGSTTNHATLNPFTGSVIRDDSGKDLGINSSADQWVHIAMTWDGSVLTTYVNGLPKITAQGSGSTTTLNTAQSILMIGCNPTNNNCFNGLFDELRVWNVARTATEIKDNYSKPITGDETGLVGYWKFDETSGATASDSVATTGHTAHSGTLKADATAHLPSFVEPTTPLPLVCP
jgi:hypothetical protein